MLLLKAFKIFPSYSDKGFMTTAVLSVFASGGKRTQQIGISIALHTHSYMRLPPISLQVFLHFHRHKLQPAKKRRINGKGGVIATREPGSRSTVKTDQADLAALIKRTQR